MFIVACIYAFGVRGNFLENNFWIPPILYMNIFLTSSKLVWIIGHVAAALAPLACASRSAQPRHVAAALSPLACPSRSAQKVS